MPLFALREGRSTVVCRANFACYRKNMATKFRTAERAGRGNAMDALQLFGLFEAVWAVVAWRRWNVRRR